MSGIKRRSKNIDLSLLRVAEANGVDPKSLHFKLLSCENMVKTVHTDDYILFNEDIEHIIADPYKMINEHMELKQIYNISISNKPLSPIKLNYEISFDSASINAYIVIYPDSKIPYTLHKPTEIYALLVAELNAIKAKNHILVGFFDEQMKQKLKQLVKLIYLGKFKQKVKFAIFNGIGSKGGQAAKLVYCYLEKNRTSSQFIEVDEDEIIIEYLKAQKAQKGFNAYGNITDADTNKNEKDLEIYVDPNTIKIEEDESKKLYISKIKGYVQLTKDSLFIDNKIKLNKLSRVGEHIQKDEDSNIEVVVSQKDTNLDSVGEGVELVSQSVHIDGHIGAKSSIKAQDLVIDGATHQDSTQEAKYATINRHKGKLRCHKATINLLEGGVVHATDVEIKDVLNGTIYAENVKIDRVRNNLKIYALNSIEIGSVQGEGNSLKIGYQGIPTVASKLSFYEKDLEDLRYHLEEAKKHSHSKIDGIMGEINALKAKIRSIKESSLGAKVVVKDIFQGVNTITFTLENGKELTFRTEIKPYEPFYLKQEGDYIVLQPVGVKLKVE